MLRKLEKKITLVHLIRVLVIRLGNPKAAVQVAVRPSVLVTLIKVLIINTLGLRKKIHPLWRNTECGPDYRHWVTCRLQFESWGWTLATFLLHLISYKSFNSE